MENLLYKTEYGEYYTGKCEDILIDPSLQHSVQLILTSPPFPLNKKKQYGNLSGSGYSDWIKSLAPLFSKLLVPNGSIVIEIGNAWEQGRPIQSLLTLKTLLSFVENEEADLRLCQEFIYYNPARLPSPAQWVTINRIRMIDSFTHVWWIANSDYPKADNTKVLRPYSKSMLNLLASGKYNTGKRPSNHSISSDSFLAKHEGSIAHNVLDSDPTGQQEFYRYPQNLLRIANTKSNDFYTRTCRERGITPHPARMPMELASFFIEFLTDEGDIVLDPFGGSNTTGFCAERLKRKWISIETNHDYGEQSRIRFEDPSL